MAFLTAYPPALALHFLLNKRWTFADQRATSGRHVAEYLHAVTVTFLIQWPVFALAVHALGWKPWLAAGVANLAQMTASFLLMQVRVFAPVSNPGARNAWHRLAALLMAVGVTVVLVWTALQKWEFPPVGARQGDYYNLLGRGFSKGSLALDLEVPAALKNAENPWDASKRPIGSAPADISYYDGKFYLYFGVVPVALLIWPFQLLTGHDLPLVYVVIFFCAGAYLWLAALWSALLRDYFPAASLVTRLGGLGALGLAGGLLSLARRGSIWEMPIAAGQFFTVAMLFTAYRALHATRPWRWLAAAGLCLGLAVGSRPTLAVAGGGLVVLVLAIGWTDFARDCWRGWLRRSALAALAAGAPLALVMGALLAYNQARFGSLLEFGLNYQLTGGYEAKAVHFSLGFVRYNWLLYFCYAPEWGRDFPFVHPVEVLLQQPADYYGYEYVYGALVICPVLWLALLLPGWAFRRSGRGRLPAFVALVLAVAVASTALLLCFNTAAARYTADFLPWWLLLGLLGGASVEVWLRAWPWWRQAASGATGLALLFTCGVAYCASAELHGVFKFLNPAGYTTVARAFNQPVALWEKWRPRPAGPLELELVFPEHPTESYEPLLTTGVSYETDYVFVNYTGPRSLRLGFLRPGKPPVVSDEVFIEPRRTYHVRIESGALYPAKEHPFFACWNQGEVSSLKEWVMIWLDDRVLLEEFHTMHDVSPGSVQIGTDRRANRRFSGLIRSAHRTGLAQRPPRPNTGGDVWVRMQFPKTSNGAPQPLLMAGRTGNADMVAFRRLDAQTFALGYESWSAGYWESGPLVVPTDQPVDLRIRLGSMLDLDGNSPLKVLRDTVGIWLGGQPVWWWHTAVPLPPGPPIEVGVNTIGSTAVTGAYEGRIKDWRRQPAPPPWQAGPFAAVDLLIGGRGGQSEPLVATGVAGGANTLAIEWLPAGRARLLYDHWGQAAQQSDEFDWREGEAHHVRLELPAFAQLDAPGAGAVRSGPLRAWVDERLVWEAVGQFYVARSASLVLARNSVGSSVARDRLQAVLLDITQHRLVPAGPAIHRP